MVIKKQNNRHHNGRLRNTNKQGSSNNPRNRNQYKQNLDRYLNLAKEAGSNGDEILAEGYRQHAEHFHRQLSELESSQALKKEPVSQEPRKKTPPKSPHDTQVSKDSNSQRNQGDPVEITLDGSEDIPTPESSL